MHESFLQYVWQLQYFDKSDLRTTDGEHLVVFHPGMINTDAGPDFANARIKIGEIDWVGNVEIHIQSSSWLDHHHDKDLAYDNVVLHVVWKHDLEVERRDHSRIPVLELRERVQESLVRTYRQLVTSSFSIPCQRSISGVPEVIASSMLEKVMIGRLERKSMEVRELLSQNGNDWDETFYQLLARSFGFKVNAEPFFQLAKLLPLKIALKQSGSLSQVEALMLGQAGFLDAPRGDAYYQQLRREHRVLSTKYSLGESKMSKVQWKFMRLRPANFPSIRLAQFAALLHRGQSLFSDIMQIDNATSLYTLFTVQPSPYWETHYKFSKKTMGRSHVLGKSSIDIIIMNTVVPFWTAYGKQRDDQRFIDRSISILQQLPSEENKVTKLWQQVGISSRNAFESQALLELFNNFCQKKSCLDCNIGTSLVRPVC